jgi:hypothetical protein
MTVNIKRIRQLAGLKEADLNMGLSAEALRELDDCLIEALTMMGQAKDLISGLTTIAPLVPEQQARLERVSAMIPRLQRLQTTPKAVKAELLDDTITALSSVTYVFVPYQNVFQATPEQVQTLRQIKDSQRRCYACLKVVGVGWGART